MEVVTADPVVIPARWWAWSWRTLRRFTSTDALRLHLTAVVFSDLGPADGEDEGRRWEAHATDSYRLAVTRYGGGAELPAKLGAPTLALVDDVGTLDLLARRIIHRTKR